MQVTKGTWRMCEQCVPGPLSSSHIWEPGNEATVHCAFLFFDAKAWPQSQTDLFTCTTVLHCGHTFLRWIHILNSIACTMVLHCGYIVFWSFLVLHCGHSWTPKCARRQNTDTQTHRNNYCNPPRACVPRVNNTHHVHTLSLALRG